MFYLLQSLCHERSAVAKLAQCDQGVHVDMLAFGTPAIASTFPTQSLFLSRPASSRTEIPMCGSGRNHHHGLIITV